ncbi:MAG TPA: GTP cyclohydrolase I FolE2, partial [Candidatus Ozemobacteraceae bacterium]|nr:GTP cyclohydrolase I FolE2 [Candidatus Ozemobacteraceae bacterium]
MTTRLTSRRRARNAASSSEPLADLQSHLDHRRLPIARVGIKRLFYPFRVLDRRRTFQDVTGEFEVYVDLTHTERATHMSRFVEIINHHRGEVTSNTIESILKDVKKRLQARRAELAVSFPYFVEKHAPVSGEASLMRYDCRFWAALDRTLDFVLTVTVPVTTLCPCSKAISKASAHNQRSLVTVAIRFRRMVWIEEVIACVEASASAEV